MLRDVQRLPTGESEKLMLSERLVEIANHAEKVFPAGHELATVPARINEIAALFGVGKHKQDIAPATPPPEHKHDVPPQTGTVERAEGKQVTINFEGRRCIHARFCVLGAPTVFRANTPGEWIFPDTMDAGELIHVSKNCPSGAITYEPKGDLLPETAPPVNTLHIRENGPYAIHAEMSLNGQPIGFRATLCRCGASRNKPFCDGAHNEIAFNATGEPATRSTEPLAVRNGPLEIRPLPNGPLVVKGNLEICAGTGRTVDRLTGVRLCRCGGSHTKPFCDNTHLKIGFEAD
jgi:CDGSH-type Zn-finger protein/uncharacterized Fe-S cluster protein YjdI